MNKYTIVIFFSLLTFIVGQQLKEFSVHKSQREEFKLDEHQLGKFAFDGSGIIPLQVNKQKELSKIVFGYLPDWEYKKGAHSNMRYDLLTHIATFDFPVSSSGAVKFPYRWPWTDVINAAHSAGTKVIMTAVCFDKDDIRKIITNNTSKQKFFANTKNIIQTYKLDGVNIDFEGLYKSDKGSRINLFMQELTKFIHAELPGREVSFAGPAVNWGNRWDLDGLTQSCDYVFIMGYSFWGSWSSTAGPCAPLTGFSHDITSVVTEDYGVPVSKYPEKIILGVPYYGHEWKTKTGDVYSKVDTANGGYISSTRFYNDIDKAETYGVLWDNKSQTAWFKWKAGTQWHQIWFDDVRSLDAKYNLAISQNLGGVGMWALGYDGDKKDLWSLLEEKFVTTNIEDKGRIPNEFVLSQNYPNPFNPTTTIKYSIPNNTVIASSVSKGRSNLSKIATSSNKTWTPRNDNYHVSLKMYDILGREVATLVNKNQKSGNYEVVFNASYLTSGTYFYRITAGDFSKTMKLILLK